MQQLGALWKKSKNEKEYMSGVIRDMRGDIQIVIFQNDNKENDSQPDYLIYRSEPRPSE